MTNEVQQFTVPQFIDVEDKIIGPITIRQFLIMLVGALFVGIFYKVFDFSLFVFSSVLVALFTFIIAFIKINGRPFHYFALNLIQTMKKPALRVWNKTHWQGEVLEDDEPEKFERIATKTINLKSSRLDQMSLIVDTYGQYRGDDLVTKEK